MNSRVKRLGIILALCGLAPLAHAGAWDGGGVNTNVSGTLTWCMQSPNDPYGLLAYMQAQGSLQFTGKSYVVGNDAQFVTADGSSGQWNHATIGMSGYLPLADFDYNPTILAAFAAAGCDSAGGIPLFAKGVAFNKQNSDKSAIWANAISIDFQQTQDSDPTGTLSVRLNLARSNRDKAIMILYPFAPMQQLTLKSQGYVDAEYMVGYTTNLESNGYDYTRGLPIFRSYQQPNYRYDSFEVGLPITLGNYYLGEAIALQSTYNQGAPMVIDMDSAATFANQYAAQYVPYNGQAVPNADKTSVTSDWSTVMAGNGTAWRTYTTTGFSAANVVVDTNGFPKPIPTTLKGSAGQSPYPTQGGIGLAKIAAYMKAYQVGSVSFTPQKTSDGYTFFQPGLVDGKSMMWYWGDSNYLGSGWEGDGWVTPSWFINQLTSRGAIGSGTVQTMANVPRGYYVLRVVYMTHFANNGGTRGNGLAESYMLIQLGAGGAPIVPPQTPTAEMRLRTYIPDDIRPAAEGSLHSRASTKDIRDMAGRQPLIVCYDDTGRVVMTNRPMTYGELQDVVASRAAGSNANVAEQNAQDQAQGNPVPNETVVTLQLSFDTAFQNELSGRSLASWTPSVTSLSDLNLTGTGDKRRYIGSAVRTVGGGDTVYGFIDFSAYDAANPPATLPMYFYSDALGSQRVFKIQPINVTITKQ